MVRWLPATLLSLLLLGGCSRPVAPVETEGPPPAPGEPTAPPPGPATHTAPPAGCSGDSQALLPSGYVSRAFRYQVSVTSGTCEVTVDETGFEVGFRLPAEIAREQVTAGLSVDAPVPPRLSFGSPHEYQELLLRFPPGHAGEVISVRLAGRVGAGGAHADLGFRITRLPSPRITAELKRSGGDWEPLTTIPVLPKQPLAFRFRMQGGADPAAAQRQIRAALGEVAHQIEQPAPDTLVVAVPEPPPLLHFDFRDVPGEHGAVTNSGATVYIGEPPRLVLLDPATGREEPLREVPADLLRASLSPDGQWLMLSGMAPAHPWEDQVWVVNLQTNEIHLTPFRDEAYRASPVVWLEDRLVLPVGGQVQVWHLRTGKAETRHSDALWWETASLDGRYIVGFAVDYSRENKQWLAPTTLFIHDVETGTDRVLPDLVQYRVPHRGGFPQIRTAWEKDGRHLLVRHFESLGDGMEDVQERFMRVEVSTGTAGPATGSAGEAEPYQVWLPGPGGWQVSPSGGWGAVVLRTPGGEEKGQGEALVIGWTEKGQLLLVRWNAQQRRYRWRE